MKPFTWASQTGIGRARRLALFFDDDDELMNAGRQDENPRTWFRSDRVFLSDGKWFFHTREGVDVGPYESQFEAAIEAGMLKELLRERGEKGEGCMSVIREFVLDSYAMGRPLTPSFNHVVVDQG